MSKEYTWYLTVENTEKEIVCQAEGNKYFIYSGDAFVTTFYKSSTGDVDEEITLCGIPCRFVAFNEKPDLLIVGTDTLLGSGKSYTAEKAARGKANKAFALAELFIGIFTLVALLISALSKGSLELYFLFPIPAGFIMLFPIGFIILGSIDLYNLNKKNKKDK